MSFSFILQMQQVLMQVFTAYLINQILIMILKWRSAWFLMYRENHIGWCMQSSKTLWANQQLKLLQEQKMQQGLIQHLE